MALWRMGHWVGWVLVQVPRETDSEPEIACSRFTAERPQDPHLGRMGAGTGQGQGAVNGNDRCSCHRDSANPIGSSGASTALQSCPVWREAVGSLYLVLTCHWYRLLPRT